MSIFGRLGLSDLGLGTDVHWYMLGNSGWSIFVSVNLSWVPALVSASGPCRGEEKADGSVCCKEVELPGVDGSVPFFIDVPLHLVLIPWAMAMAQSGTGFIQGFVLLSIYNTEVW